MQCEKCGKRVYANETCVCGQKAPKKNNGGVRANSVICFTLLAVAVLCLLSTLSLRTIVNKNLIVEAIEEVELADIEVSNGKKLDQYIYEEFINDPRITVANVDNLLKDPFIKDFLIEKIEDYQDFSLNGGNVPTITSNEIVELIDGNAELLFNEVELKFLEPDKAKLRDNLSGLDEFGRFSRDFLDTWFGSRLWQTFFSYANVVFLLILMLVIFLQWLIVYKANNRRAAKMLFKYGIAVIIPSALILAGTVNTKFNNDMKAVGELFGSAIIPFIAYSAAFLALGIVIMVIGIIGNKSYKASRIANTSTNIKNSAPEKAAAVQQSIPEAADSVKDVVQETVNPEKADVKKTNVCPNCSHENKENAVFCSRCGTKL